MRLIFNLQVPKNWVCVWRGHRWTLSRSQPGFVKCMRCSLRQGKATLPPLRR